MDQIQYQELQDSIQDKMDEAEDRGEILKVANLTDEAVKRLEIQAKYNNEIVPLYDKNGDIDGFWLMPDKHIEYENDYE